ncbi:MAG: TonB-dependent receptor plug domain-containing protein, partial [Campylobacterota bacterium]|nr:TonB-dependent receptor plug domain-containing protein [Campylobacterota bacterium]
MSKKIKLSLLSVALIGSLHAQQSVKLDTITVTSATKSKQSIKDVTSNIDVITSEEIEEKYYTTVSEALNSIAGISFTNNGGLGSKISLRVRGMNNNRVLVLIDGVRLQDPSNTEGANITHLMVNNIEKIEVIKGAQSGVWGADATAGVINI